MNPRMLQHFRQNPYFENEVLSKEVIMEGSGETSVTGTEINWKEGKVHLWEHCNTWWSVPNCRI